MKIAFREPAFIHSHFLVNATHGCDWHHVSRMLHSEL